MTLYQGPTFPRGRPVPSVSRAGPESVWSLCTPRAGFIDTEIQAQGYKRLGHSFGDDGDGGDEGG